MLTADQLFAICGDVVLPCWLLLVFAPKWKWTQRICATAVPVLLACVYGTLLVSQFGKSGGGFGSLSAVKTLFENPWVLLAGWIHYLAFDLFIGAWEVRDARKFGIPHYGVIPCLALTFLVGPVGFALYCVLRLGVKRKWEPAA
jgi:Domain of unknown function (DUF4281)